MRFNPMLLMFLAVALFSALVMPPDLANAIRKVDVLFAPVASPARKFGEAMNDHWSSNTTGRTADERTVNELRDENEALKIKLATLSTQYEQIRHQLGEVGPIRPEIRSLCRFISVMGTIPDRQMLTLEGSSVQGLQPQMAVLSPNGLVLVGKLDMVGLAVARVQLLTDLHMHVQVGFGRYPANQNDFVPPGDVSWVATGDGAGRLVVSDYKIIDLKANDLRVGDWVMLRDADWPLLLQGYKIGSLEAVKDGETPLVVNLIVRPEVDLMKLHDVMVLMKNQ
jgi:cell shape-determining protein MreC